jgi:hypothetical protein
MFMPTTKYLLRHAHYIFFEVMVPMLEEEEHQLGGGGVEAEEEEAEAEEEVVQGLLLCSMCTIDHCLGYVIISG